MAIKKRPQFREVKQSTSVHANPEELFKKLSGRASTHGYLRGPQQDVLRAYAEKDVNTPDVAFELPTGNRKNRSWVANSRMEAPFRPESRIFVLKPTN